jgi:hypothetical protein
MSKAKTAKATLPMAPAAAKLIARKYYNAGTAKHDILVSLMTAKYPQDQQMLQDVCGVSRITNRINEIVEETPLRINRTKAQIGFYSKPVNLYTFAVA